MTNALCLTLSSNILKLTQIVNLKSLVLNLSFVFGSLVNRMNVNTTSIVSLILHYQYLLPYSRAKKKNGRFRISTLKLIIFECFSSFKDTVIQTTLMIIWLIEPIMQPIVSFPRIIKLFHTDHLVQQVKSSCSTFRFLF